MTSRVRTTGVVHSSLSRQRRFSPGGCMHRSPVTSHVDLTQRYRWACWRMASRTAPSVVGHQADEAADLGEVGGSEVAEGATADQAAFGDGTDVLRTHPGGPVQAGRLPVDRDMVRKAAVDGGAGRYQGHGDGERAVQGGADDDGGTATGWLGSDRDAQVDHPHLALPGQTAHETTSGRPADHTRLATALTRPVTTSLTRVPRRRLSRRPTPRSQRHSRPSWRGRLGGGRTRQRSPGAFGPAHARPTAGPRPPTA